MKLYQPLTLFFLTLCTFAAAQQDTVLTKTLNDYPQDLIQKDEYGNRYFYDAEQKATIYEINGETVVVMDELILAAKPKFNNELDRNYYYFLNKRLNRVYPLFLTALQQYRDIKADMDKMSQGDQRKYIRARQNELADQYEKQLRDLTTTEGRIFAKLMNRATGKPVYELIRELRGGWSAFWWNVKGNAANIELKKEYDPHADRSDQYLENLLQTNWNLGYLTRYAGYQDFKVKK